MRYDLALSVSRRAVNRATHPATKATEENLMGRRPHASLIQPALQTHGYGCHEARSRDTAMPVYLRANLYQNRAAL